jgi:UDP-2,3-diacylglucosamine pyrophosphatase LpxH
MFNLKRKLDIAVISDVYLGTQACNAKKLLTYLNSIEPKHIVLNGGITAINNSEIKNFPKTHLKVIKKIIDFAANGIEIAYITNTADDKLGKFLTQSITNITIVNKLLLEVDGKKSWLFHGRIFENHKLNWLARFGKLGHYILMKVNGLRAHSKPNKNLDYSTSTHDAQGAQNRATLNSAFEKLVSDLAIEKNIDYVICGHTRLPKIEFRTNSQGSTTYMNSGDWIENFTALEYRLKRWKIYNYSKDKLIPFSTEYDIQDDSIKDLIAAITIVEQPKKIS